MTEDEKIDRARQLCAEVANILDELDFGHDIRFQTRDFVEGRPTADRGGEVTNTAQERLDDYRAAVAFIAADAWDGCPDCMEILQAARGLDIECDWAGDPNAISEKLTSLRRRAALAPDKGVTG